MDIDGESRLHRTIPATDVDIGADEYHPLEAAATELMDLASRLFASTWMDAVRPSFEWLVRVRSRPT